MQVHAGQQFHHIGAFVQRNPVELHVMPGCEMAVIGGELGRGAIADLVLGVLCARQELGRRRVKVLGNVCQHPQLGAVEFAVGHGHPQHGGVALHIPAVLQAQGAEFVVAQAAGLVAGELVAVLRGARVNKLAVEFGVLVHAKRCWMRVCTRRIPGRTRLHAGKRQVNVRVAAYIENYFFAISLCQ